MQGWIEVTSAANINSTKGKRFLIPLSAIARVVEKPVYYEDVGEAGLVEMELGAAVVFDDKYDVGDHCGFVYTFESYKMIRDRIAAARSLGGGI